MVKSNLGWLYEVKTFQNYQFVTFLKLLKNHLSIIKGVFTLAEENYKLNRGRISE